MADQPKSGRAQAQFNKLLRAEDGRKGMSEYEAERAAVRAKTERLKALRLARDAEQAGAAAAAPPKPAAAAKKPAAGKAKGKAKPASLSQYLKDQSRGGRKS